MGLRALLFVPMNRQELHMQAQAHLKDLQKSGTELTQQSTQAYEQTMGRNSLALDR
jgi:hypothetical protein